MINKPEELASNTTVRMPLALDTLRFQGTIKFGNTTQSSGNVTNNASLIV